MNKLEAIFYDMDGTLVFFKIDYILARRKALDVLENAGIPKGRYSVNSSTRSVVDDAKLILSYQLKKDDQEIKEILKRVNSAIVKIELEAAKIAKSVDHVASLLQFGKEKGIKQIICTYNTHEVAEITLKNAGLLEFVDEIYGRDDVKYQKPDLTHIKEAINKYNIKPENSLLVGDHSTDIQLGKNFGCLTIGVQTNHNLNSVNEADHIVPQEEFTASVKKILEKSFNFE